MGLKVLLIILIFTILGCSKDDDLPQPEADLCNCTEEVVHRRQNGNIVFQDSRPFISECLPFSQKEEQILDVTITTTISCTRP